MLSSATQRALYLQAQSAMATVINTGGTWTSTTAKFVPFTKADLVCDYDLIPGNYKIGNASSLAGIPGRASKCTAAIACPFMPSGAAGTAPQIDPLLQNIFGVAPTVVASTSVTYNQADGPGVPLTAALFNRASSNATQQFAFGIAMDNATLNLGGDGFFGVDASGMAYYVLDSDNWANEPTAGKGGLTTSPTTEPSPSLTGAIIPPYASSASVSIGGNSLVEFVSAQLSIATGRKIRMDGGQFGTGIVQGPRVVALKSIKLADSDSASAIAVKALSKSKAASDVVFVIGGGAGYIVTVTVKSAQLSGATYSESSDGGLDVTFANAPAHASSLTGKNELVLALT